MKLSYNAKLSLIALLLVLCTLFTSCNTLGTQPITTDTTLAENTAAQAKDERAKKARNENQGEEISVLFFNLFFRQLNKFRLYRHKSSFIIYYA